MTEKELRKHPDFPEWIKSVEGQKCANMETLTDAKYLYNRLSWAFDAGRDCVWDQYQEGKRKIERQEELLKAAMEVISVSKHLGLYCSHGDTVREYNEALEKYNSLKKP